MANQQALRGFRDLYPAEKAAQGYIFSKVREVARLYGYEEYDGPIVEPISLYAKKSSEELLEKQTFQIKPRDKDDQWILRPEMTPTLARLIAAKSGELVFPLRYMNIGPRFRYEAPQKGRSREFWQCDFDILGSQSVVADAETLATAISILTNLGLTEQDFEVKINSRAYLAEELEELGVNEYDIKDIIGKIDRMDKQQVDLPQAVRKLISTPVDISENEYFTQLFSMLTQLGVEQYCSVDLTVARGLDYYTGLVFEIKKRGEQGRTTLLGGGRYDNLISDMNSRMAIPGVGFAISDTVLMSFLAEKGVLPDLKSKPSTILVTVFNRETINRSLEIATQLRRAGVPVEVYPDQDKKLDKQLKYADRTGIPFVIIAGPEELRQNKIKLKNMKTQEQTVLSPADLLAQFLSK